jgi:hypothetical protein
MTAQNLCYYAPYEISGPSAGDCQCCGAAIFSYFAMELRRWIMDLERAIEYAIDGEAVLFIGAGFSSGATNIRGTHLKTGLSFAAHLANLAEINLDLSLEEAAEEFVAMHGIDRFIEELKNEFSAHKITKSQLAIAKTAAWKRIYTTNYDNVMEVAYSQSSKILVPITLSDNVYKVPKKNTICVHFNGFIDRIHRDNIWSEIKLTDTSYLTASVAESEWAILFRQDLSIARAVFFVGYSAYDLDIRRIIFATPMLKEKCFFILGPSPDNLTKRRVSALGSIITLNTDEFGEAIIRKKVTYSPPTTKLFLGYSIVKLDQPKTTKPFSDKMLFDLFMFGNSDIGSIWHSMHSGPTYF